MRISLPLGFVCAAATLATILVGVARAAQAMHPADSPLAVRALRTSVDRYRMLTWTYERAARRHTTPTSFSYRRSSDEAYLQWTVAAWQRHAYEARSRALAALRRRLALSLPRAPGLHAPLRRRIAYDRSLTLRLRRVYPGNVTRAFASARAPSGRVTLLVWQRRAALATLAVARHATRLTAIGPRWLTSAFLCIHHYEGSWSANTGNGYYGGLQMDSTFMRRYGSSFVERWGTADRWPAWAQLQASVRAYEAGRGFWPWPRTAQACGLL